jgi:hypothetical protein
MTTQQEFISLVDCEICRKITDMECVDAYLKLPDVFQFEVPKLLMIIETKKDDGRYCLMTSRLLKCPLCATYFYYHSHDQDWDSIDQISPQLSLTLIRYSPKRVIEFLKDLVSSTNKALSAFHVSSKENTGTRTDIPQMLMKECELSNLLLQANKELDLLKPAYDLENKEKLTKL